MKWFKHDSNSQVDAKIKKVKLKYGMEGYGLYWHLLECIAMNVEKHNLTFELEHDAEIIADDTNIHIDRVQEMMSFMIKLKLFEQIENRVFCMKMATRTDEYTQQIIKKQGLTNISRETPDTLPINSEVLEENRIEEKRREETNKRRFTPPSLQEVVEYCGEKGYRYINPEDFINFYNSNGWKVGRNKMKCWKSSVAQWNSRNKPKDSDDYTKGVI